MPLHSFEGVEHLAIQAGRWAGRASSSAGVDQVHAGIRDHAANLAPAVARRTTGLSGRGRDPCPARPRATKRKARGTFSVVVISTKRTFPPRDDTYPPSDNANSASISLQ